MMARRKTSKVSSRRKASSSRSAPAKKKSSMPRLLTAEGWRRLMKGTFSKKK